MHRLILIMGVTFVLITGCMCQLYERIPKYQVGEFMLYYLESRGINDCFYNIMEDEKLYLKCLRNGELVTLSLQIIPQSVLI